MLDYFIQATELLIGDTLYQYSWGSTIMEILAIIYIAIIIISAFKIFKWLFYGWWH